MLIINRIRLILAVLGTAVLISGCSSKQSGIYQIEDIERIDEDKRDEQSVSDDNRDIESEYIQETVQEVPTVQALFVHVCGAVNNPGVYELDDTQRIFNAIEAAGGFREDAAVNYVNLAEHLKDGMKIQIPTEEELEEMPDSNWVSQDNNSYSSYNYEMRDATKKVNINSASASELTTINGIGLTRAQAIVEYREVNGKFSKLEDIKNVSGIGDGTYSKIKEQITIGD